MLTRRQARADKGAEELDRLRRALCIKRADVQQIHRDVCGHIYQQARPAPGHTHWLLHSLTVSTLAVCLKEGCLHKDAQASLLARALCLACS